MGDVDDDELTPPRLPSAAYTIEELLRLNADRLHTCGDAIMDLSPRLERNTEALLSLKRATYEREEAHDQRERGWSFTLEKVVGEHAATNQELTKELGALRKEITTLSTRIEVGKELSGIADTAKENLSEAKTNEGKTVQAIESLGRRMEELSGPHGLIEAEDRREPWQSRAIDRVLKASPVRVLLLAVLITVVIFAMTTGLRLLKALDHSHILPRQGQEHSELK